MLTAPGIITLDRNRTPAQRAAAGEYQGRRSGRLAGGHIADLVDLRSAVQLCPDCRPKFNDKGAGYTTKRNLPTVIGKCDGCNSHSAALSLFVDRQFACNL